MKNLMPFFVMIGLLVTVAIAIITITNYLLKRRILDKGPLDENAVRILEKLTGTRSEALKWGIILLFGGMGLVILEFIPYPYELPLPYGIELIFIALGFLVYYYVSSRKNKH